MLIERRCVPPVAPANVPTSLAGWTDAGADHNVDGIAATRQELPMTAPATEITPEFQRGWDAALRAARDWHESQAKKTLIQARRSRFPKNLEREAEVHQRSAEMIVALSPHDV
ncbi:MAG: hypothetical protein ABSC95_16395 [Acetobacteraceae bacterium]